jgi:hypothetical protein
MGTRSDVGVAISKDVLGEISVDDYAKWFGAAEDVLENDRGTLFVWKYVNWCRYTEPVMSLTAFLREQDPEDFLVVAACPEYPEDTSDNEGEWYDNPWGLCKYVSCTIEYSER